MKFYRSYHFLFFAVLIFISGCSSTENVRSPEGQAVSEADKKMPEWFRATHRVANVNNMYSGHAAALDSDSSTAIQKAIASAKTAIESTLSDKLESIRKEAADQHSGAGLGEPGFILVLREAESRISTLAKTRKTEAVKTGSGYRGFAELAVGKADLIAMLEKALSGYTPAWKAMQTSPAFSEW